MRIIFRHLCLIIGEKSIKTTIATDSCYLFMNEDNLILYDGHCRLCSWSVRWIIRNDVRKRFSFKAIKDAGFPGTLEQSGDTVQLLMAGKRYERSTAALMIAVRLRFPWPLLGIFFLVPLFFRDALYKLVARNRKRWFGESDTCFIP